MGFQYLDGCHELSIRQRKELFEFVGYETRNKYEVYHRDAPILYAAEQQKGFLGFLFRQFLGHWRTFDIHIFNTQREHIAIAKHPFRFYFTELNLFDEQGKEIATIQKQFSILSKKFEVRLASGETFSMFSPIWKIWTFPIKRNGVDIGVIRKRWSGMLKEMFLDADNFTVEFTDTSLSTDARATLLVAALFVDLLYFEKKANN